MGTSKATAPPERHCSGDCVMTKKAGTSIDAHDLLRRIHFITGNLNKVKEVRGILGEIRHINIDLPELQEMDPRRVVLAKARSALEQGYKPVLIEDTSLSIPSCGGLPGPLVKWFLKGLGAEGLVKFAASHGEPRAEARTIFGLAFGPQTILYGEGVIFGTLVSPRGEGFGWDSVFQPDGSTVTFGEMSLEDKNKYSMRAQALHALKGQIEVYLASPGAGRLRRGRG